MYTPKHYSVPDVATCHDMIEADPFGLLVCAGSDDDVPSASHLPFHLVRETGELGELHVHLARANPQSKELNGKKVRCIFSGPHAYISPTWYESGPAVPTWNYTAVHCIGVAVQTADPEEMSRQMEQLTAVYERGGSWRYGDLPDDYRRGMLKGITGFRIRIEQLIGKAKLNQNKSDSDIAGSVAGLRTTGRLDDAVVADLMDSAGKR
jgi:transcriptional regulator